VLQSVAAQHENEKQVSERRRHVSLYDAAMSEDSWLESE
jgi:hypothetical protein